MLALTKHGVMNPHNSTLALLILKMDSWNVLSSQLQNTASHKIAALKNILKMFKIVVHGGNNDTAAVSGVTQYSSV